MIRWLTTAAVVAAAGVGVGVVVASTPTAVSAAPAVETLAAPLEKSGLTVRPLVEPVAHNPAEVAPPAPQVSDPPESASADNWAISIATSGFQTEIDTCVWVRMDLGIAAPIVGAHRGCGGSIVLQMTSGDPVKLTGEGLDGSYVVTGDRKAHAGDVAAEATAGLEADVILQTCYPNAGSVLRLVTLRRI